MSVPTGLLLVHSRATASRCEHRINCRRGARTGRPSGRSAIECCFLLEPEFPCFSWSPGALVTGGCRPRCGQRLCARERSCLWFSLFLPEQHGQGRMTQPELSHDAAPAVLVPERFRMSHALPLRWMRPLAHLSSVGKTVLQYRNLSDHGSLRLRWSPPTLADWKARSPAKPCFEIRV